MKLTRQQRALVVLFSLVCAAWLCDRLFLLPQASQADSPGAAESLFPELILEVTDTAEAASRTTLITQRLEVLWPDEHSESRDLREAFMLPASWPVSVDPNVSHAPGGPRPGSAFISQHRLRAVFVDEHNSRVVIDDLVLMIGQSLEGFTLVEVDEGSATFEFEQTRFVMHLSNDR